MDEHTSQYRWGYRYRTLTLFLYNSCLGIFLTYGLFFGRVSAEFNLPPSSTAFVFGMFALLYGFSSLLMGLVMDLYGAGNTIMIGGILMSAGLITSSFAPSFEILVVTFGLLGGLGTGSMWLPSTYVIFDRFRADKVKEVTGLVSAGTAFGSLFFSPFETFLITSFGWRMAFLVVGIVVLLFAILAYSASRGGSVSRQFNIRAGLRKFKTLRFDSLYVYYLVGNAFSRTIAVIFIVPLLEAKGMGLYAGSLALSLIGVGSMFGRMTTGTKRTSEEVVASLGFILQGTCIMMLLFANDILTIAIVSLLLGIGYGAYIPQFPLLIRRYYGTDYYGTIFGTLVTSFGIGAFVGPLFEGYQLSFSGDYSLGFYVSSVGSLIVGLHLLLTRAHSGKQSNELHPSSNHES